MADILPKAGGSGKRFRVERKLRARVWKSGMFGESNQIRLARF
jgi:hypothetical protein